jgi:hypothetical protein
MPSGLAVQTAPMTAHEAQSMLRSLVADPVDASIYPVDD